MRRDISANHQELHSKYRYPPQGTWKDPQIGQQRNKCAIPGGCRSWGKTGGKREGADKKQ